MIQSPVPSKPIIAIEVTTFINADHAPASTLMPEPGPIAWHGGDALPRHRIDAILAAFDETRQQAAALRSHPGKRGEIVAFADDPHGFGQAQWRALRRCSSRRRARR